MQVTKIFGLDAKEAGEFPNVNTLQSSARSAPASRRQSVYLEKLPELEFGDSGVSCLEDQARCSGVKRDAACSPVEVKTSNPLERSQSFTKHRRMANHHQKPRGKKLDQDICYGFFTFSVFLFFPKFINFIAQSHSRKTALPVFPSSGTASESETEQLFVPGRRRRKSSNEDAYEAEDSSE